MRKLLILALLFFVFDSAMAYDKYWVTFTDKNGTPYTVTNPAAFLSARSIQRRINQNIPVTQRDLPVNPSYVQQVLATGAVNLRFTSRWFNAMSIQTTDAAALTAIAALPFVQSVQTVARYKKPDGTYEETFGDAINEKTFPGNSVQPLAYNYGASFNQINMIGGDCLHYLGYHGEGMVIAILDAGFEDVDSLPAFDSLWANNQILGTWDFVTGDSMVFEDHWHGEMVLSCIGGYLDGQLVGTAPKAEFWLLRTEDVFSEYLVEEDNWVAGAEFADSVGANILNTSLGYTQFDSAVMNHTYSDLDGNTCRISIATDYAVATGMFAVCAAGNSGASSWYYIGAPADADSVLAVGAVDPGGVIATFSSRGPSADGDIKPNVCAQGLNSIVASQSGGIQTASGTSFASPITCGAVSCLWQANPAMTNMEVFTAILQSASLFNNPDDSVYGYGIPDFCIANIILSEGNTGIFQQDNLLKVYPNPFSDAFTFTFYSTTEQVLNIELYDVTGRKVFSDERNVNANSLNTLQAIDVSVLSKGVYFFTVTTKEGKFTRKLIKE